MLNEINHHLAEVIILDNTTQHVLTAVLPVRRRLWTIHYGRAVGCLEAGYRGADIPAWSAALQAALSANLSAAAQGPHTVYRDVRMTLEPRKQPPRWPPLAT